MMNRETHGTHEITTKDRALPTKILDCGGRAKRRHRFWSVIRQPSESGVALRFPPQSKIGGCGASRVRHFAVQNF
jgi:hypothetical protein